MYCAYIRFEFKASMYFFVSKCLGKMLVIAFIDVLVVVWLALLMARYILVYWPITSRVALLVVTNLYSKNGTLWWHFGIRLYVPVVFLRNYSYYWLEIMLKMAYLCNLVLRIFARWHYMLQTFDSFEIMASKMSIEFLKRTK